MNYLKMLSDIPATLIHGQFDFGSQMKTAVQLHQMLPGNKLLVIEKAEHDTHNAGMTARIVESIQSITPARSEFG